MACSNGFPPLVPAIAVAVLLVSIIPGTFPLIEAGPASGVGATTSFHWEAPRNYTGPLAVMITVTVQEEGWCEMKTRAAGRFNSTSPIAYWQSTTLGGPESHGTFIGYWGYNLQAHAGPADTRRIHGPEGRWDKLQGSSGRRVREVLTLNIAAFDLNLWNGTQLDRPLIVDIECDVPIDLTLKAGQDARSFTEESLEGGVGATVDLGPMSRRIARDDGLSMDFESSYVRFQAVSGIADQATEAEMTLDHPDGTERWTWDHSGPEEVGVDGGPGRYDLALDWSSQEVSQHMYGAVFGVDPVDSLDDAV